MQVFFPLSIEEKRERSGRELGGSNTRMTQFVEKLHESFHHLLTSKLLGSWNIESMSLGPQIDC